MSIREAAIQVLRAAGQALTAQRITECILAQGLWQTQGKTPHATVAARLYTDIQASGERSPFVLVGPQTFGLRELGAKPSQAKPASPPKTPSKPGATEPRRREATGGEYSFLDAAEKVLERFGDKKPMHYRQITEKALELGWVATSGRTPEATMYSQIVTEIRRHQERGQQPRFVRHGRGYVSLSREFVQFEGPGKPRTRTRSAGQSTRKSHYDRLRVFLQSVPAEQIQIALSFAEVEGVLGHPLPPFALRHPAWWANTRGPTSQGSMWLSVGWKVEKVHLKAQIVVFRRAGGDPLLAVPRHVNDILEHKGTICRVDAATLCEWIRFCRRVGWHFQAVVLFERGGLAMGSLSESDRASVEEDYGFCKRALLSYRNVGASAT
ncbi:winged helix-turn-helix domain-containing protein [Candidatus Bathyarchaeota archaeon]|nr:winged helix-turn-helix domain-containing protein [Candidatus Bathyarchaeota archaeon]